MNQLLQKRELAANVNEYVFSAPEIAKYAKAGQFVILRVDDEGERVPFTLCDSDNKLGTVTLLVQSVGYSTYKLAQLKVNDYISDMVGPLGNATDLNAYNKIILVGGGIGVAVVYPQAKYLHGLGKDVTSIIGARNESLVMYEQEMRRYSNNAYVMTDDGSYGEKGFVTSKLKELLDSASGYDCVFAVGPLMMMRAVCELTRPYGIKTVISMNSIMVDGTGMCGGCRLTVDGKTKYACVDGPEFDGHSVDFAEAINRSAYYKSIEQEHLCRLKGEKK